MYRAAGPRELWTEHLLANPGSFSTTFVSDDWALQSGRQALSPARVTAGQTVQHDTTAYNTIPIEESWYQRYYGGLSPAKVTASATGATRGGLLT
jgi:hypothetical protein